MLCNLFIIKRIGGGKSRSAHSACYRLVVFLIFVLTIFSSCGSRATVCGVPVQGSTPWELAAAIHDSGDGSFVPVTVDVFTTKAYIHGYTLPDEQPAQVVCDVKEGKVVWAVVDTIGKE